MSRLKLLLDFDGVILKSPKATRYQLDRSAKFVRKTTQLPLDVCKRLNAENYPKYGHTVAMLNRGFKRPVTLDDYNAFVFDPERIERLKPSVFDKEVYLEGVKFRRLFRFCETNGIDWRIFTNAHKDWVTTFGDLLDLPITQSKILWPRDLSCLKPNEGSYADVERRFGPEERFVFVDDTRDNLPVGRDRWIPVHWDGSVTVTDLICELVQRL